MKSLLLVVFAVLVASACAGLAGPYHHYYVPGFQHTYVHVPNHTQTEMQSVISRLRLGIITSLKIQIQVHEQEQ